MCKIEIYSELYNFATTKQKNSKGMLIGLSNTAAFQSINYVVDF